MDDHDNNFLSLLDKAIRILCFISEQLHGNADAPAPAFSLPPQLSDDGKTLFFPTLRAAREVTAHGAEVNSQKEVSITFSMEEISKMPRYFRKLFRTQHKTAHVRLKDGNIYEIRLQIDGVRISASSRFLDEAKIKFLQKLKLFDKGDLQARQHTEKKPVAPQVLPAPALSVSDYALQYLETFKKPNISEKHFYNLSGIVRRHISRFFGDKLLRDLTATDCQKFLNELIQIEENSAPRRTLKVFWIGFALPPSRTGSCPLTSWRKCKSSRTSALPERLFPANISALFLQKSRNPAQSFAFGFSFSPVCALVRCTPLPSTNAASFPSRPQKRKNGKNPKPAESLCIPRFSPISTKSKPPFPFP